MHAIHRFKVTAKCPSNGETDRYEVTLESHEVVLVEDLLELCAKLEEDQIYQEELTKLFSQTFDAKVTTVGTHFGKVTTTVVVEP